MRKPLTRKERMRLALTLTRIVRDFGVARGQFNKDMKTVWAFLDRKERSDG